VQWENSATATERFRGGHFGVLKLQEISQKNKKVHQFTKVINFIVRMELNNNIAAMKTLATGKHIAFKVSNHQTK